MWNRRAANLLVLTGGLLLCAPRTTAAQAPVGPSAIELGDAAFTVPDGWRRVEAPADDWPRVDLVGFQDPCLDPHADSMIFRELPLPPALRDWAIEDVVESLLHNGIAAVVYLEYLPPNVRMEFGARVERVIAGTPYPTRYVRFTVDDRPMVEDGIFLAYIPSDVRQRGRIYFVYRGDLHPPLVPANEPTALDTLVASLRLLQGASTS